MPGCAIKSCKSRSSTHNLQNDGITFHLFPKNKQHKEQWIKLTGQRASWVPTKTSTICSKHFTRECFDVTKNKRRMLFEFALPTLHLHTISVDDPPESLEPITPAVPDTFIKCTCPNAQIVGTRLRKLEIVVRSQKKKIKHLHYKNRKFEAKVQSLNEKLRLLRENLELDEDEFRALTKTTDGEEKDSKENKVKELKDLESNYSSDCDEDPLSKKREDPNHVKEEMELNEDPLNTDVKLEEY